ASRPIACCARASSSSWRALSRGRIPLTCASARYPSHESIPLRQRRCSRAAPMPGRKRNVRPSTRRDAPWLHLKLSPPVVAETDALTRWPRIARRVQGLDDVAKRLAERLGRIPRETPRLAAFAPGAAPARVVAVDGSSVVVAEAGDLLAGAYRVGVVRLRGREPETSVPAEPTLVLLTPDEAHHEVGHAMGAPVAPLEPGEALHALRSLAEIAAAREALRGMSAGDLLLLDGALAGTLTLPALDVMLREAR